MWSYPNYENSTITNVQLNYMATMDYRRQANPNLTGALDVLLTVSDIISNSATAAKIINLVKNKKIKDAIVELVPEVGKYIMEKYNNK